MMGYITRSDRSMLVAMPGAHPMGHYGHVPFLMARRGSAIANALGLTPMPGVAAAAFDDKLVGAPDESFVFRCLDGCDLDVDGGTTAVDNRATQLAQMYRIAPGKRLRNDLRRWANATATIRGGELTNSSAHPDAGKVWTFGAYQQPLTDATLYSAANATVRLFAGTAVTSYRPQAGEVAELWVVSSAGPRSDVPDPKRLAHGEILFQFFANADPLVATCEQAEGRLTVATELPCSQTAIASSVARASAAMPPHVDLCFGGGWCEDCV
jgi:hypothetical protein